MDSSRPVDRINRRRADHQLARKSTGQPSQSCVVDLNEITSIDKDGEQVLLMMLRDGAKFVATGLYTKHLLESLSVQDAGGDSS